MTDVRSIEILAAATVGCPILCALLICFLSEQKILIFSKIAGIGTGCFGILLSSLLILDRRLQVDNKWIILGYRSAITIAVISIIGALSVGASFQYMKTQKDSIVGEHRRIRAYYIGIFLFWAITFAVPMAANIGFAWLLIEATTAMSALLVGFSGKKRALEAGWKYLILTSMGLGVALLGISLLASKIPVLGLNGMTWSAMHDFSGSHQEAMIIYIIIASGLATKIGWAPVHNWLPDAHSEAPPPVSGMLSAALLPTVLIVAWRFEIGFGAIIGRQSAQRIFILFGILSIAIAIPFLWQSLPWKRMLAYSSLENMGILALGIGFGNPIAIAVVVIHILGHAIAKSYGFYTSTPLFRHEPNAYRHTASGIARSSPALGVAMGTALGTLAAIPPSPLFISEVFIVFGGIESGHAVAAVIAVLLLALVFLGISHSLIELLAGKSFAHRVNVRFTRIEYLSFFFVVIALLGLTVVAFWLPSSHFIKALV